MTVQKPFQRFLKGLGETFCKKFPQTRPFSSSIARRVEIPFTFLLDEGEADWEDVGFALEVRVDQDGDLIGRGGADDLHGIVVVDTLCRHPDIGILEDHQTFGAVIIAGVDHIGQTVVDIADEHRLIDGHQIGLGIDLLGGRLDVLRSTESEPADAYADILRADRFKTYCDLGAYNGDSIRALREHAPELQIALAMEPDRRNFRKLETYAATLQEAQDPLTVIPVGAGAWSTDATLAFHGSGNRNAGLTDAPATAPADTLLPSTAENPYFGKSEAVPVRALDSLMAERMADGTMPADTRVDFIKYDVEGAEREALLGSRAVIERDAPALLVSVYHRSADIFALPQLVHELNPAYRLYLRRMAGLPAWDINLYAVAD